jgi:hypothetical protein
VPARTVTIARIRRSSLEAPQVTGVVLSLLGRDGNNQNITLATALVNVESEANILWILERCLGAGIHLADRATFCDRGKILGAAPRFFSSSGVFGNLRYCTLHILCNMRKKFKKSGQAFDNVVWAIQDAETHDKYAKALLNMKNAFGDEVVAYLQEIGPVAWTVHANMCTFTSCTDDIGSSHEAAVGAARGADLVGNAASCVDSLECESCGCTGEGNGVDVLNAPGAVGASFSNEVLESDTQEDECECCQFTAKRAVPMFKWRTSNFVESDNNALIQNGVRKSDPCSAFYKLTADAMQKLCERNDAVTKWQKAGSDLTPYAKKLWLKEKARVGEYLVVKSSMSVSYVFHPGDTTRSRKVDVNLPSCTCATFDQVRMACCHIFAALRDRGMGKQFIRAFHPAYMVKTYAATFSNKSIALPVRDTPPGSLEVRPSPFYKQAGRHVTRRIASSGEIGARSTYVCRTCRENGHNRRTCRRHANECDEANPDLIACSFELPSFHSDPETHSRVGDSVSDALNQAPVEGQEGEMSNAVPADVQASVSQDDTLNAVHHREHHRVADGFVVGDPPPNDTQAENASVSNDESHGNLSDTQLSTSPERRMSMRFLLE